ncbi:hypothetical protein PHYBLDRAFT_166572 [Phycomyces blakesleeanus NRRL 1555(-)]|uniref:Uncharacterized protein n=1 Tax=Phycomyces blakesleeanus (strain ATCC 8743b / DSM 1359 / FGSC 10004 / NBRC 33097 / NRRL 1555) TaxID=763407 RepID=A0A162PRI0_PHYB8|nr:hypothetical protein PHYBLDRAFT_166572 [Phycomyces blakesleeanus NRRL 1555(-)]OAD75317.1 hypothetical protein PHYBLDRAFT_166572 [Phycomyces blakesleeanus NRRL 1555(-)]|eukprot:XP_018293357.1 hypothetical protein PHYBLDRAFT_166572 [Phycomyces blakesleeanus NRRL 1555(-)]
MPYHTLLSRYCSEFGYSFLLSLTCSYFAYDFIRYCLLGLPQLSLIISGSQAQALGNLDHNFSFLFLQSTGVTACNLIRQSEINGFSTNIIQFVIYTHIEGPIKLVRIDVPGFIHMQIEKIKKKTAFLGQMQYKNHSPVHLTCSKQGEETPRGTKSTTPSRKEVKESALLPLCCCW